MGASVYWPLSVLGVFVCFCVCVCLISNQSTSKNHIMCQTPVILTPCCIKHTSRFFWYEDTKARHVYIHLVKQHIKCGMIIHSAKETGQHKEQLGWGL